MDTSKVIRYLTCIKALDGIPLFTRCVPSTKQLPFALIGVLNGIFTYGDSYGVKILNANSDDYKIVWKMYHSNVTLILIENNQPVNDNVYFEKLNLIFDTLVLLYGLDDLINIKNVEKFKREIRITYSLVDSILDTNKYDLFGDIANGVDVILSNETQLFQTTLDSIAQIVNTHYSCLMINGRVIVASKAWWELKPSESFLITLLCMTLTSATCRDIPIYLPYKSPHSPLRLLTYQLSSNDVTLCFICSQRPAVDTIEQDIIRLWHPLYKPLINHKLNVPRNIPISLSLDQNMLAFLLINKKTRCALSSLMPSGKLVQLKPDEIKIRFQVLRALYQNMMSNYFYDYQDVYNEVTKTSTIEDCVKVNNTSVKQAYTLIGNLKCYGINNSAYEMYAVYSNKIPTHAVRGITQECLTALTKNNLI